MRESAKDREEERERALVGTGFHVFTAEVTWNFGSTYCCSSISVTFLSVLSVNLRITRRAKEETDRRGSTVRGSAAAAYQDAVVSVSEIIMWCDVSQVSFARGSARIALSYSHTRRFAAILFSHNPLSPPSSVFALPSCTFSFFGVYDTCRVSALRAGREERVT